MSAALHPVVILSSSPVILSEAKDLGPAVRRSFIPVKEESMKEWIFSRALGLALPLVIGPIAFALTQWLKKSIATLDAASPAVKQAVVIALSFLLAGVVKFAGGYLPPICGTSADSLGCLNAI